MKKRHIAIALAGLTLAAGLWMYRRADAREVPAYRFVTVTRGDLESTVSATGTLSAVTTVQVGTQVSGQLAAIYVDFNDKVKKGQLLARIDPTLQQQAVADAQAGLERVQAQLLQAQQVYDQDKPLFEAQFITATEFNSATTALAMAKANVKSAQIAVDKARQNLSYTSIYAPIDGVVVERDVDVGQTVAASLSAPQLFLIANDLAHMQILASVDESDIGQIKEGQPVRFTVQAYPTRTFTGTVQQVRLQSKTTDNVVNYTTVIAVQNQDGALLPGMTATVAFLTGSASDVFIVPNAALRFRPTSEMLASLRTSRPRNAGTRSRDSTRAGATAARRAQRGTGPLGQTAGAGATRATSALLWHVDTNGTVTATRVHTGLSDGQQTQIQGEGLTAGMQVIAGVNTGTSGATAASAPATSPFQTPSRRRGGPPGGF